MLIPYSVWIILGETSYFKIFDNLDSDFTYIKLLMESGNLFGFDLQGQIPNIMNGVDRSLFKSGFYFTFILFYLFPPAIAYILNHALVHIIGYVGMYVLLKRYFVKKNDFLIFSISLCFAFLDYYHIQVGIAIAGQPLLLYAFLNLLHEKNKILSWAIICLFPFYSFIIGTLPFFIPILIVIGIVFWHSRKKLPKAFFIAIAVISVINLFVEFNLVYSTLIDNHMVSHRIEKKEDFPTIFDFVRRIIVSLVKTNNALQIGLLSPLPIIIAFVIGKFYRLKIMNRTFFYLIGFVGFLLFWVAFYDTLFYFLSDKITIIKSFDVSRFYFMLPLTWLLLFTHILKQYNWKNTVHRSIAITLLLISFSVIIINNEEIEVNSKILASVSTAKPSFSQFYDEKLYDEIKMYLGKEEIENFNFLNVGIYPTMSQYNGLKTLDGYQNNYPLDYKHKFREIIAKELDKKAIYKKWFDDWGNWCYTYSSELDVFFENNKLSIKEIENLQLNWKQASSMKAKYVLSSTPINLSNIPELAFKKAFTNKESFWKLYLYEIL